MFSAALSRLDDKKSGVLEVMSLIILMVAGLLISALIYRLLG